MYYLKPALALAALTLPNHLATALLDCKFAIFDLPRSSSVCKGKAVSCDLPMTTCTKVPGAQNCELVLAGQALPEVQCDSETSDSFSAFIECVEGAPYKYECELQTGS